MRRRNRKRWKKAALATCKEDKCATKYCRNKRADKITRYKSQSGRVIVYENKLRHCWKCRARMLKASRPATYVLNMIRHSARKRNLPFTITIAQFQDFCAKTGYLEKRGNKPNDMTIDRKDWDEGYHIWNIQAMTHAENSGQGADNTPREERATVEEGDPF